MVKKIVINFLKTKIGKKIFIKTSESKNKQMVYDRLQAYLYPPSNVVRWVKTNEKLIEASIKESKGETKVK